MLSTSRSRGNRYSNYENEDRNQTNDYGTKISNRQSQEIISSQRSEPRLKIFKQRISSNNTSNVEAQSSMDTPVATFSRFIFEEPKAQSRIRKDPLNELKLKNEFDMHYQQLVTSQSRQQRKNIVVSSQATYKINQQNSVRDQIRGNLMRNQAYFLASNGFQAKDIDRSLLDSIISQETQKVKNLPISMEEQKKGQSTSRQQRNIHQNINQFPQGWWNMDSSNLPNKIDNEVYPGLHLATIRSSSKNRIVSKRQSSNNTSLAQSKDRNLLSLNYHNDGPLPLIHKSKTDQVTSPNLAQTITTYDKNFFTNAKQSSLTKQQNLNQNISNQNQVRKSLERKSKQEIEAMQLRSPGLQQFKQNNINQERFQDQSQNKVSDTHRKFNRTSTKFNGQEKSQSPNGASVRNSVEKISFAMIQKRSERRADSLRSSSRLKSELLAAKRRSLGRHDNSTLNQGTDNDSQLKSIQLKEINTNNQIEDIINKIQPDDYENEDGFIFNEDNIPENDEDEANEELQQFEETLEELEEQNEEYESQQNKQRGIIASEILSEMKQIPDFQIENNNLDPQITDQIIATSDNKSFKDLLKSAEQYLLNLHPYLKNDQDIQENLQISTPKQYIVQSQQEYNELIQPQIYSANIKALSNSCSNYHSKSPLNYMREALNRIKQSQKGLIFESHTTNNFRPENWGVHCNPSFQEFLCSGNKAQGISNFNKAILKIQIVPESNKNLKNQSSQKVGAIFEKQDVQNQYLKKIIERNDKQHSQLRYRDSLKQEEVQIEHHWDTIYIKITKERQILTPVNIQNDFIFENYNNLPLPLIKELISNASVGAQHGKQDQVQPSQNTQINIIQNLVIQNGKTSESNMDQNSPCIYKTQGYANGDENSTRNKIEIKGNIEKKQQMLGNQKQQIFVPVNSGLSQMLTKGFSTQNGNCALSLNALGLKTINSQTLTSLNFLYNKNGDRQNDTALGAINKLWAIDSSPIPYKQEGSSLGGVKTKKFVTDQFKINAMRKSREDPFNRSQSGNCMPKGSGLSQTPYLNTQLKKQSHPSNKTQAKLKVPIQIDPLESSHIPMIQHKVNTKDKLIQDENLQTISKQEMRTFGSAKYQKLSLKDSNLNQSQETQTNQINQEFLSEIQCKKIENQHQGFELNQEELKSENIFKSSQGDLQFSQAFVKQLSQVQDVQDAFMSQQPDQSLQILNTSIQQNQTYKNHSLQERKFAENYFASEWVFHEQSPHKTQYKDSASIIESQLPAFFSQPTHSQVYKFGNSLYSQKESYSQLQHDITNVEKEYQSSSQMKEDLLDKITTRNHEKTQLQLKQKFQVQSQIKSGQSHSMQKSFMEKRRVASQSVQKARVPSLENQGKTISNLKQVQKQQRVSLPEIKAQQKTIKPNLPFQLKEFDLQNELILMQGEPSRRNSKNHIIEMRQSTSFAQKRSEKFIGDQGQRSLRSSSLLRVKEQNNIGQVQNHPDTLIVASSDSNFAQIISRQKRIPIKKRTDEQKFIIQDEINSQSPIKKNLLGSSKNIQEGYSFYQTTNHDNIPSLSSVDKQLGTLFSTSKVNKRHQSTLKNARHKHIKRKSQAYSDIFNPYDNFPEYLPKNNQEMRQYEQLVENKRKLNSLIEKRQRKQKQSNARSINIPQEDFSRERNEAAEKAAFDVLNYTDALSRLAKNEKQGIIAEESQTYEETGFTEKSQSRISKNNRIIKPSTAANMFRGSHLNDEEIRFTETQSNNKLIQPFQQNNFHSEQKKDASSSLNYGRSKQLKESFHEEKSQNKLKTKQQYFMQSELLNESASQPQRIDLKQFYQTRQNANKKFIDVSKMMNITNLSDQRQLISKMILRDRPTTQQQVSKNSNIN